MVFLLSCGYTALVGTLVLCVFFFFDPRSLRLPFGRGAYPIFLRLLNAGADGFSPLVTDLEEDEIRLGKM